MNGDLVDYQVTYERVKIGGVPIDFEPVRSVSTGKNNSRTLKNLDPYSKYEITVAARTRKGLGPRTSASYGGKKLIVTLLLLMLKHAGYKIKNKDKIMMI